MLNIMANIKTAISIEDSLFEKIERLARDLKVPRSHIFVLAVEEYLRRQENLRPASMRLTKMPPLPLNKNVCGRCAHLTGVFWRASSDPSGRSLLG
jgi:hypothetical protein